MEGKRDQQLNLPIYSSEKVPDYHNDIIVILNLIFQYFPEKSPENTKA